MSIRSLILSAVFLTALPCPAPAQNARAEETGPFVMSARSRTSLVTDKSVYGDTEQTVKWEPKKTAVLICDVWDRHWCKCATERVDEMAPRINAVVKAARARGAFVIHAPSDCMDFYKDTPQRKLATSAPAAKNPPKGLGDGCRRLDNEPPLPIDDSDGGCDDVPQSPGGRAWKRQHAGVEIAEGDAVSASGIEIYNLLEARGIDNVIMIGVHTNMCIVGRPFGLRQLTKFGKNAVLVRDLTDAMYNPKKAPFVSHRRGTELVIEHIEKHICPTVMAADIVADPPAPRVVFVIGEDEYKTEETLPAFAKKELEPRGVKCVFVHADAKNPNDFPDMKAIKDADLVVLSVRRRAPKEEQLKLLREYLESGKPLVGIRTASHAFDLKTKVPEGHAVWPAVDTELLGVKYEGHFNNTPESRTATVVHPLESAAKHPILTGIGAVEFRVATTLYKSRNLAKTATRLLDGTIPGTSEREPVAWTNTYKGGRIFYTTLGGLEDFKVAQFRQLLVNAIYWGMERPVPGKLLSTQRPNLPLNAVSVEQLSPGQRPGYAGIHYTTP